MLQPVIMNVSSKGAVVIPAKLRKVFGIKPKGKVMIVPKKDSSSLEIMPTEEDPIEYLSGILKGKGKTKGSWVKMLLKERRKDMEIDEREYAKHSR